MSRLIATVSMFLLFGGFVALVPTVDAATFSAIPGVRASVYVSETGYQDVSLRWILSPGDPDQTTGDLQYNVTVGASDQGASTAMDNFSAGDGFHDVTYTNSGASASLTFSVHIWNTPDESGTSCTVTVDTGNLYEYDECANMNANFTVQDCLPFTEGDDALGFNWADGVVDQPETEQLRFRQSAFTDRSAAALNLGGDSASIRLDFNIEAAIDGQASTFTIFYSETGQGASEAAFGNGRTSGAFSDGFGAELVESGSDWNLDLFYTASGQRAVYLNDIALDDGVTANSETDGYFEIDPWSATVTFGLGNEEYIIPNHLINNWPPASFNTLWLYESGASTNIARSTFIESGTNELCVSTGSGDRGGSNFQIGSQGAAGQTVEDFDGEGGFIGDPQFPGLDVTQTTTDIEVNEQFFGYLLAAVIVMGFTFAGFRVAGVAVGAAAGLMGLGASALLSLVPLWFIAFIASLFITLLVLNARTGGAAT